MNDLKPGQHKVIIPDEAIYYIVDNYLERRTKTSGVSVLVGVSTSTVQEVIGLLVDWAALRGHIKDGVLSLGEEE